jgi:hypothetical protein
MKQLIFILFLLSLSLTFPYQAKSIENIVGIDKSVSEKRVITTDTVKINRQHRFSSIKRSRYSSFKGIIVKASGFSFSMECGNGGGGNTSFTNQKIDEPDYKTTYENQFRSQHLMLGIRYNFNNFFTSINYTREHLNPQDGKMTQAIPTLSTRTTKGLTNYFSKDKNYYGVNVGYDIRNSSRMFFSPYLGYSLFSYVGNKKSFNELQKNRHALNLGLNIFFSTNGGNLLFFVNSFYSKQFFQQSDIIVKDPRTYQMITLVNDKMEHNQIFVSFGCQFKLSNRVF